MSHIGKKPISLPEGVTVTKNAAALTIRGPWGTASHILRPEVDVSIEEGKIIVVPVGSRRRTSAYWGLERSILANIVEGVSRRFEKKLEIEGIGYRAVMDGPALQLSLGFSHPVRVEPPAGIAFRVEKNSITVSGIDKTVVGDVASSIRRLRPPEPYKGKGIRYAGEVIRRKAGKKVVASGAP